MTKNSNVVTFGSKAMIVFFRVFQVIFLLFFFSFGRNRESLPFFLYGLFILGFVEAGFSVMVFGTLNEDGLAYQRWSKVTQVQWPEIAYGGIAPVGFIKVKLIGRPIWSRYLLLKAPDPPLRDDEANLPGAIQFCKQMEPPSGRSN